MGAYANLYYVLLFCSTVYAVFANSIGSSMMYGWDIQTNQFILVWSGPPSFSQYPIIIPQAAGNLNLIAVADRNITAKPTIQQLVKIKDSDFAPR